MRNDILIISDQLIEPPSEHYALRTVTMFAHFNFHMNVLLHTTQLMKDTLYHWMKPKGLLDYVDYLLVEHENEDALRVDIVNIFPHTIQVQYIRLENQINLIDKIKSITEI